MTMTDGVREVLSNVVVIGPPGDVILPRARVEVRKTKNGFEIAPSDGKPVAIGYKFTVAVSYRLGRSKRLNWDLEDFLLSDLFIDSETRGLRAREARDNLVRFEVTDPDFYGKWLGFDILRDLIIDVREV
jgi:hypothetical protein